MGAELEKGRNLWAETSWGQIRKGPKPLATILLTNHLRYQRVSDTKNSLTQLGNSLTQIATYLISQGRNLYKLSQKITSWVLLGSIHTKINQKISKCEITCTSYFSSCIVKNIWMHCQFSSPQWILQHRLVIDYEKFTR